MAMLNNRRVRIFNSLPDVQSPRKPGSKELASSIQYAHSENTNKESGNVWKYWQRKTCQTRNQPENCTSQCLETCRFGPLQRCYLQHQQEKWQKSSRHSLKGGPEPTSGHLYRFRPPIWTLVLTTSACFNHVPSKKYGTMSESHSSFNRFI